MLGMLVEHFKATSHARLKHQASFEVTALIAAADESAG